MKKRFAIILVLLCALSASLSAESWYEFGSMKFSISAGPDIPLTYVWFGDDEPYWGPGADNTGFSLGGIGGIDFQVFLSSWFSLGAEIGFEFNMDKNGDTFTSVPILAKFTFLPFQTTRFEIPVSIGIGGNYLSYDDKSKMTLGLSFEVEARYYFWEQWGIGIKTGISFIPEWYTSLPYKGAETKNALFTSIPVMLTATYRH